MARFFMCFPFIVLFFSELCSWPWSRKMPMVQCSDLINSYTTSYAGWVISHLCNMQINGLIMAYILHNIICKFCSLEDQMLQSFLLRVLIHEDATTLPFPTIPTRCEFLNDQPRQAFEDCRSRCN